MFGGSERATFEGDRIRLLEDEMQAGSDVAIQDWLDRFSSLPGHVGLRHETSAVAVVDFEAMPTEHRAPPPHG